MKNHFKIIALVIALLMICAACASFVSCDALLDDEGDDGEGNVPAGTEATPEDIEKTNYDKQFFLSILPDSNPMDSYWVEKSEGDAMSEAVYARQEKVRNWIGVEIIGKSAGNHSTYVQPFRTAVKNQDGSVDTLMTHVNQGVAGFISERFVQNLDDFPGIDLDKEYWNKDFMDALAIEDNYFLGFSDFNILYTHVIAFNKTMMESYANSMEKTPYEMVEDYEWTLDAMISLAKLVYNDKTGDGKSEDDTFGITGQQWVPWIGFLHASDINLIEMSEKGAYEISVMSTKNKEKTTDVVTKLKELSDSNYGYFTFPDFVNPGVPAPISLTTGRTLMQLTSTFSLNSFLNYNVKFGVLPYPMYDTNQKDVGYRSLQWGGYLCVPAYVNDAQMVGETLELLAFYSEDVKITFYEKQLGKQVADVPEDRRMLDIVWDGVCTDMGQTYGDECPGIMYFFNYVTRTDTGKELSSYLATFERTSNGQLSKFIKRVKMNINNNK